MQRRLIVILLLSSFTALAILACTATAHLREAEDLTYDGHVRGRPFEDGLSCLVGQDRAGLVVAPMDTGAAKKSEIPAEMAKACYLFSAAYNPCTGQLRFADAITELGPQKCPGAEAQP